ncbi:MULTISPECIES: hypothetical protein [Legionella]|uniref:Uncharacterized protein n=1 Tax=Legionella steelei TaxID=947033 RepID=A0A0W0ZD20_9GAMM|nr:MULTISPECIES: hypothetical protein [Legionella]KTD66968.1 hypothetical protein Lste_3174 [Legionella steelei]MBN9227297.1 DUF1328 domain-containing protein [Legionella steelei]OJW14001.1 MAG: DUF1328 domain-containing protein [Legionella sp. 39-23]
MLKIAFIFLVIAIISGVIEYRQKGTNPSAKSPVKIIFYVSALIFLITLILYLFTPATPVAHEVPNPLLSFIGALMHLG